MTMMTALHPMREELRKRAAFIAPAIILLFMVSCLFFLPARYETNDELANIDSLNPVNEFCGTHPTPLIGKLTGLLLSYLYNMFPDVPWYGMLVYLFIFSGLSLILNLAFKHLSVTNNILVAIALFYLSFHVVVITSFTAATLILEFAVFLCFVEFTVVDSHSHRKDRLYFCFLCVLLAFSFLIRWKVAFLFGILACPVVLFLQKKQIKKWWLPIVMAITVVGADRVADEMTKSDEDRDFASFTAWRTTFHDTSKGSYNHLTTPIALQAAGWTKEDYRFYRCWILYDNELFNVEKLRIFLKENTRLNPQFELLNRANFYKSMEISESSTWFVTCILITFLFMNFHYLARLERGYLYRYLLMNGFLLTAIVICTFYRFPQRIHIPLYILLVSTVILGSSFRKEGGDKILLKKKTKIICGGLAVVIMSMTAYPVWYRIKNVSDHLWNGRMEKEYFKKCLRTIERLSKNDPILVIMNPSDSLGSAFIHPLLEYRDYPKIKRMIGGMNTNSARYHHVLNIMGLKTGREFMRWTIDNKRTLFTLVARNKKQREQFENIWNSYYNRRIRNNVRLKIVYDSRGPSKQGVVFYRMSSVKN
jgi:hypothetical protein